MDSSVTATKKLFPLALDTSVGGCVSSGESYEQAFARETWEETTIDIKEVPYVCVGYVTPQLNGVAAFMKVYKIYSTMTPAYNQHDFCEYFWLTPQEILDNCINQGDLCKPDLPKLIKIVYP